MADDNTCRVLSIQSSVVYGYVGNKSATFPLQVSSYRYRYQKGIRSPLASTIIDTQCGMKSQVGSVMKIIIIEQYRR